MFVQAMPDESVEMWASAVGEDSEFVSHPMLERAQV